MVNKIVLIAVLILAILLPSLNCNSASQTTPTPILTPQPKTPIISMTEAIDLATATFLKASAVEGNRTAAQLENLKKYLLPPVATYDSSNLWNGYGYWEVTITLRTTETYEYTYKVQAGTGQVWRIK